MIRLNSCTKEVIVDYSHVTEAFIDFVQSLFTVFIHTFLFRPVDTQQVFVDPLGIAYLYTRYGLKVLL